MANTTTYSEEQIAQALAHLRANRGNAKKTAQALGIPRTTLRQWAGRAASATAHPKQVEPELVDVAANKLAQTLDRVSLRGSERLLEAMDKVPIESMNDAKNAAIAVGIAIEKASFARGGPTSRTQTLQVTLIGAGSLAELGQSVLKEVNPALAPAHMEAIPDKV